MSQGALQLTVALLRHFLTQTMGQEALDILVQQIGNLGDEEFRAKLQSIHQAPVTEAQLVSTAKEADECFRLECGDPTLHALITSLPLAGLESLQAEIAKLPAAFDESSLANLINGLFESTWPDLPDAQRGAAIRVYLSCLRRALQQIPGYGPRIISWAVLRMDDRLERVEQEQTRVRLQHEERANALSRALEGILGGPIALAYLSIADEPPVPPTVLAFRNQLVQNVQEQIGNASWLALIGSTGLGKTQLARIVWAHHASGTRLWIALPERDTQTALNHIRQQLLLALSSGQSPIADQGLLTDSAVCNAISEVLGRSALVIIDNIPAIDTDDRLHSYLVGFASVLQQNASTLLTTGQASLPALVRSRLGNNVVERNVPPLDEADVRALLEAWGAPASINNDKVPLWITASCSGHPALVSATIAWLHNINWKLDSEAIEQLITGDAADRVRQDYARLLPQLIPDPSTREFIYRLSLIWHPFDQKIAQLVARVKPSISLAGEKLVALHGPWISRTPKGLYEVSALLRESGKANLSEDVKIRIHAAIADQLLATSPVSIDQINNIVLHLFASNQGLRLAQFIVQVMIYGVRSPEHARYLDWLSNLFLDDAPKQIAIPADWMVVVRASQVRLRMLSGGNYSKLLRDLNQRIGKLDLSDENNVVTTMFAYANSGVYLDTAPAVIGFIQAVRLARLMEEHPHILSLPLASPWEMAWFPLMRASTLDEYREILQFLESFAPSEVVVLMSNTLAGETLYIWVDRVWHTAAGHLDEKVGWDDVFDILRRIEQLGARTNLTSLVVAVTRARAIVYADYLKRVDDALVELRRAPHSHNPIEDFIVSYTTASILSDSGRSSDAIQFYLQTLSSTAEEFEYYRFDSLRRLAEAYGKRENWTESAHWCVEAIHYARLHSLVPNEDQTELLGELAWIRWNEGKLKRASGAIYGAAMHLLNMNTVSDLRQKEVLLKLGHLLGWMAYVAAGGTAPELTVSGDVYMTPFPGMLARKREKIAELQRPGIEILFMQLGLLAVSVNVERTALLAYSIAHERAIAQGLRYLASSVNLVRATTASRLLEPAEALEIALSGVRSTGIHHARELTLTTISSTQDDIEVAWRALSTEKRIEAERLIFKVSLGPAICRMLETGIANDIALDKLEKWRLAFEQCSTEEPERWFNMIRLAAMIFQPYGGKAMVQALRPDTGTNDGDILMLYYLALSVQYDTPLNEISLTQAYVYEFVLNTAMRLQAFNPGIGALIVRTWRHIADKRGFYLTNPMGLRRLVSSDTPVPSEAHVARILLAAAEAVGTKYESRVYDMLSRFAEDK